MSGECDECGEHALECKCKDCIAMDKLKHDLDAIYTRVPIDLAFDPERKTSTFKLASEAKFLENAQRSKNIQDDGLSYEEFCHMIEEAKEHFTRY